MHCYHYFLDYDDDDDGDDDDDDGDDDDDDDDNDDDDDDVDIYIYILVLRCSFPCALKLNVQTPIGPSNQDYCDKIGPALRQISMQDHLW
jgi:hypothetical protein